MALPQQFGGNRPPYQGNNNRRQFNRGYQQGPRRNERIKATEVRVIGPDGQQIGLMATRDALQRARDYGLDLVEIAATAHPPVCRIVDYGKFQYEESKKQKKQKATTTKMKEVKLRPRCDVHDLMIKVKRAENFLYHGHKLKLILSFRFRELEHPEVGYDMMKRAIQELAHIGTPDYQAKLMGRSMSTTLTPVPQNKRKLIHNSAPVEVTDDDDDEDEDDGEE
ncbi:MAG: translation initiation factor IF-3 [Puniceicoccales bacterium]|jgi:translation initiation factor IF-3|nr:translation initiation factor IF-3 [Puniceicoccales bacterium]